MKKVFQYVAVACFAFALFLVSSTAFAQGRTSLKDSLKTTVAGAKITINYSSPAVDGRTVWGDLVPYDKMWRAGANQATTFITDKDIMVEGKKLAAGKYTLFATPGKDSWKITFNSETGQWGIKRDGTANADPAKNVLEVTVKPKPAPMTERLKYVASANGFSLVWDKLEVPVSIK
ncbi:DUF2911 domain-containing protein [Mucilaginibacter auburnensis]|uniref:DUF2911 family protein n=1 Tax=Mucilaginibacter auburnensis TaxID=1457233 RepID=A0A2H9VNN0_9SPHI|nr:DUF2911 domain-containing protein [Mucilaginibacter auburnensis]PJJ79937.1 Protein of unknown function (DUF2911) [Mucilaginibacter auburnensis]